MCVRSFGMDPASIAGGVVVAMHRMVDLLGIRSGGPSSVQPAMIGRRIEITVWRNGALVDVVCEPTELQVR